MTPPVHHNVFPLAAAMAWLFGQSIGYGGDAAPMGGAMEGQRILSTRTPSEALTMYVVAAITMFVLLLLVTLPSISAVVLWPELRNAGADRELVYGKLMKEMLPHGAMGLLIAAMMAATMSVVGDNLNFGSQVMVSDIYRRWFVRGASEKHYMVMGKVAMAIIVSLAVAVVFNVSIITNVAIFMLQLSAAELPANWAQWWWWRFNGPARIAASFGGAAIFCLVVLGPQLLLYLGFTWAGQLVLEWYWSTLLVMGLTTVLWVTVALLTKPDPDKMLDDFYQRVRPLGWWGKYASRPANNPGTGVLRKRPEVRSIIRGLLVAIAGFAATSLLIQGLTELWFARYTAGAVELLASIILFIIFKKTSRSFLDMLEQRAN
jgi:Na+/proline symporter